MRDLHKGVWQMILAMLISGSIGAFVLLSGLPVTEVVFWRCLIGAIALFIFIRMSRKPFSPLTRITLLLAILGGIALVVNWLLLFAAYERISIGLSTVVYNTQPFMLVLMGMLFGERVSLVKWGWLFLAFGGAGRGLLLCANGDDCPQAQIHCAAAYCLYSGADGRRDASAVCPHAVIFR